MSGLRRRRTEPLLDKPGVAKGAMPFLRAGRINARGLPKYGSEATEECRMRSARLPDAYIAWLLRP